MKQLLLITFLLFTSVITPVWAATCDAPDNIDDYRVVNGNYWLFFGQDSSDLAEGIYVNGDVFIGFARFTGNIYATGNITVFGQVDGTIYAEGATNVAFWASVSSECNVPVVINSFCDAPPDLGDYTLYEGDYTVPSGSNLGQNLYVTGTLTLAATSGNDVTQVTGDVYVLGDLVLNRKSVITGSAYVQGDIDKDNNGNTEIDGESCENMEPTYTPIDLPVSELQGQCNAIFKDAVQSYADGRLTMWSSNARIIDSVNQFDFKNIDGGQDPQNCGDGPCSVSGLKSQALSAFTIPDISGQNINANPSEWNNGGHPNVVVGGDTNDPDAGLYQGTVFGDITVNQGSITFLQQADPLGRQYQINSITLANNSAVLNLNPGVYAVKNFNASGGGKINIIGSGQVYLFIENPSNLIIDIIGEPNQLNLILNRGTQFTLNQSTPDAAINGSVYVNGDFLMFGSALVNGRVAAKNLTVGGQSKVNNTAVCGDPPDDDYYFEIVTLPDALTCEPHSLQVNVKNSEDDTLVTDYIGEIKLANTPALGTWSLTSGFGTLTDSGRVDGSATYQFASSADINNPAPDQGSVILGLSNTIADTISISVSDDIGLPDSKSVTFHPAMIKTTLTCIDTINGYCINRANKPFLLTLTALKENDETSLCESYDPTSIAFWSDYVIPSDTAGTAVEIDTQEIGKIEADAKELAITFVGGIATVQGNYPDAGEINIHVKDSDDENIIGQATLIVNPLELQIESIENNPAESVGYDPVAGGGFIRAAVRNHSTPVDTTIDTFNINVKAVIDCSDNSTNNRCSTRSNSSDNPKTPSFNNEVTLLPSLIFPSATSASLGTVHSENGENALSLDMQGGELTYSNLSYDEVGVLGLQATSVDYIQAGSADGVQPGNDIIASEIKEIGRFYPDRITYTEDSFFALPSCLGNFTYLGEEAIEITYSLSAHPQSAQPQSDTQVTKNYDDSFGYPVAEDFEQYARDNSDNLFTVLQDKLLPDNLNYYKQSDWKEGVFSVNSSIDPFTEPLATIGVDRDRDTPQGPYFRDEGKAVNYFVKLSGIDGETLKNRDKTLCNEGDTDYENHCLLGDLDDIIHGRLQAANGHGSEFQLIRTKIEATYFNGSGFIPMANDNCTLLNMRQVSADPTKTAPPPDATPGNEIAVGSGKTQLSISGNELIDGNTYFEFSAPDSRGTLKYFIDLRANLDESDDSPWLIDAGNAAECPDAIITPPDTLKPKDCIKGTVQFGLFRGNDRIIYRNQTFE